MLKGEFLLGGFIVIKPENEVGKQLQLLATSASPTMWSATAPSRTGSSTPRTSPAPFYLWLVEHLFRDNELIAGTLRIGGEARRPRPHRLPLNLLGGATDHITPPAQVFALADAVVHACRATSRGARRRAATSGLFMGTEALRDHWPVVMASVLEHSRPDADAAAARRRARKRTARERAIPAP